MATFQSNIGDVFIRVLWGNKVVLLVLCILYVWIASRYQIAGKTICSPLEISVSCVTVCNVLRSFQG